MKHFFFNSPHHCLVLLLLMAAGSAMAQIQESPLDTQILPTGQMFSLIIKGDGESDPPARISAEGLPPESVFLRNLDGSRTFMWIPDDDDVGTNSFLVTIADGSDEKIFATYPINLEVINPASATAGNSATAKHSESSQTSGTSPSVDNSGTTSNQEEQPIDVAAAVDSATASTPEDLTPVPQTAATVPGNTISGAPGSNADEVAEDIPDSTSAETLGSNEENQLLDNSGTSLAATADNQSTSTTPADTVATETDSVATRANVATATQLPAATVVDIETEAELSSTASDTSTQVTPTQSTAGTLQNTETTQTPANPDTTDSDAAGSDIGQSAAPAYPLLIVPDEVTISINNELTVPIQHSSDSGGSTQLRAINLPQGASLSETPSGHVLVWTPTSQDTGSTAVILIVSDAENASLSTTRRLAIEVTR